MDRQYINENLRVSLLKKFNPETMNFLTWLNCLEYMCDILRTKEEEMGKCLLNMVETSAHTKITDTLSPRDPFELSYEELTAALIKIYSTHEGKEAANFRLYSRVQFPKESIEHYAFALKKLFSKCSSEIRNLTELKKVFINGIEDEENKAFMLKYTQDVTFTIAVELAKQRELAKRR